MRNIVKLIQKQIMKKTVLLVASIALVNLGGHSQETNLNKAKENFQGFNATLNLGLLEGRINKFSGESKNKWDGNFDWETTNLQEFPWGRGVEHKNGAAIGLNIGYNWVIPARFLIGVELGAAKTDMEFNLYGNKIAEEIPLRGSVTVVKNADLNLLSSGNLVVGKVFGKQSDYLLYAKGGVVNGQIHYSDRNDYSYTNTNATGNAPEISPYHKSSWNWGYNVGGGIKYAISPRLSVGLEYLYTKFEDLEQTTGSNSNPYELEITTKQHLKMHTVNAALTLNLFKSKKKCPPPAPVQPVYYPEQRQVRVDTVKLVEYKTVYTEVKAPAHEFGTPEIGKTITLQNIYYDLNKSFVREGAKPELDKVISYMKEYPTIKIELKSHTDSRGNKEYNQALSQKRAEAAADYIIKGGISPDRITAKGYGESQPVNECVDGVNCSEEQHQQNRRTEITVVSVE